MGTCPECKFDGSQELPEGLKFPDGYYAEKRIKLKEITVRGKKTHVHEKDDKGKVIWITRMRCPACGFTDDKKPVKEASFKSKKSSEGDD